MLALVHDETNVSCPADQLEYQNELLRTTMADINMDCPLTSDSYVGINWEDADQHKNQHSPEQAA